MSTQCSMQGRAPNKSVHYFRANTVYTVGYFKITVHFYLKNLFNKGVINKCSKYVGHIY